MNNLLELPRIPEMREIELPVELRHTNRSLFERDADAMFAETEDGGTLFHPALGTYARLDAPACEVWRALNEPATLSDITSLLVPEDHHHYWRVRRKVYELIMALLARGMVRLAKDPW